MKIGILFPTRERPEMAMRALDSLFKNASNEKNFNVYILFDHTDKSIKTIIKKFSKRKNIFYKKNFLTSTMGQMLNLIAVEALKTSEVIVPMPDDYEIETKNWDILTLNCFKENGSIPICGFFKDPLVPTNQATFTVLNKKWITTVGYYLTSYFPFWFDDVWIDEISQMIGKKNEIPVRVISPEGKGKTPRMRNLPFWTYFFHNTIDERQEDALKLLNTLCINNNKMYEKKLKNVKNFVKLYKKNKKITDLITLKKWEREISNNGSFWKEDFSKEAKYCAFELNALSVLFNKVSYLQSNKDLSELNKIIFNISLSEFRNFKPLFYKKPNKIKFMQKILKFIQ